MTNYLSLLVNGFTVIQFIIYVIRCSLVVIKSPCAWYKS